VLNGLLLDRARDAGCRVQRSRVMSVDTTTRSRATAWRAIGGKPIFWSSRRGRAINCYPETRALQRDELEMTQGYFVPQTGDSITIKFLRNFEGYNLVVPVAIIYPWGFAAACRRIPARSCATICKRSWRNTAYRRRAQSLQSRPPFAEGAHVFRAKRRRQKTGRSLEMRRRGSIPSRVKAFLCIRSGELLGRSLAEGCPEKYPAWVKATFCAELEFAARIVRRFYRGSFLGSAVTTRMVQFLRRSPVFGS